MADGFRIDDASAARMRGDLQIGAPDGKAAVRGELAGLAVTVASSQESLLADAAEELTFSVDNTEELELKERKERDAAGPGPLERVKLYQELMRRDDLHEGKLEMLTAALRSAANAKDALERARGLFPDPADAWAAMAGIAEGLPGDHPVREAMAELERTDGAEIRASMAGALAGADFSDLGPPLELKNDYVRAAVDFPGPMEMLGHILERFGPEGFDRGVDFLNKALAADLACERPSGDKTSLEAVSGQLGRVRILNGVRSLGEGLAERWRSAHGQEGSALSGVDFLKFVLDAARDPLPSASVADPLVALAKPPDIEREVLFRQDLVNAVKNVSIQAFGDAEPRGRVLAALQEGLDLAVAREDEWLAAMEEG